MTYKIDKYLENSKKVLDLLDHDSIYNAIDLIKTKIEKGKKIITCGNGGSACTASHYITDWNKSYNLFKGGKFRGLSLCDNIGLITAHSNDICYEEVFSGQLKAIGDSDDLLIVVSGSGNSPNVLKAIQMSKELSMTSLSIVGYDGGKCLQLSDHSIHVKSFDMQICEDIHLLIGHIIMKNICF